eukprot:Gb_23446 [translate_table: standard]
MTNQCVCNHYKTFESSKLCICAFSMDNAPMSNKLAGLFLAANSWAIGLCANNNSIKIVIIKNEDILKHSVCYNAVNHLRSSLASPSTKIHEVEASAAQQHNSLAWSINSGILTTTRIVADTLLSHSGMVESVYGHPSPTL